MEMPAFAAGWLCESRKAVRRTRQGSGISGTGQGPLVEADPRPEAAGQRGEGTRVPCLPRATQHPVLLVTSWHLLVSQSRPDLPSEPQSQVSVCPQEHPWGRAGRLGSAILNPAHDLPLPQCSGPLHTHPSSSCISVLGQYHHLAMPGHWALFSNFLHLHPTPSEAVL